MPTAKYEVLAVAVEPEPVVVIRVAGRRVRDRQRRLVDRVVVERCEHGSNATGSDARPKPARRRPTASNGRVAASKAVAVRRVPGAASGRGRRLQGDLHVGRAGGDQLGDRLHAAGEVGPAVVAPRHAQRRLHLQPVRVAPGRGPGVAHVLAPAAIPSTVSPMIGIHASPYRTSRSRLRAFSVPATHSGTPPGWNGFGSQ